MDGKTPRRPSLVAGTRKEKLKLLHEWRIPVQSVLEDKTVTGQQ